MSIKSQIIQKYYMRAKRHASCIQSDNFELTDSDNDLNFAVDITEQSFLEEYNHNQSIENENVENIVEGEIGGNVIQTGTLISFNKNNSDNENFNANSNCDSTLDTSNFKTQLKHWAIRNNITHIALNELLYILKLPIPIDLPYDARTLLGTKRTVHVKYINPGNYYHFGLRESLRSLLNNLCESDIKLEVIELNINIDGLPLSKSSNSQVYPILCCIVGTSSVEMVGIYHGNEKPKSSNEFLAEFVDDAIDIVNNGVFIQGKLYKVKIKSFVCDAPAKAFIKCIKNHTGYSSCTKCYIEGDYIENRVCFPNANENSRLRTDLEFRSKLDENHHNGTSIIEKIPGIDMVQSFPLDYMHLVCLGVVKKILLLWCCGKPSTKLCYQKISAISSSLIELSPYIPKEFNRKPRSLSEIKRWKATELRQFLFYTGPLVLKNNISKDRYNNFLALHVALIILSQKNLSEKIEYACELLKYFVKTFRILYGSENVSHNVHNLLHLTLDVNTHGIIDNFSAFPFENFLQSILKSVRKCDKPLQQIIKRHSERNNICSNNIKRDIIYPIFKKEHTTSKFLVNLEFSKHFMEIDFNKFSLKTENPDNCCRLKNGNIITVQDIVFFQNKYKIIGIKHTSLCSIYKLPCESSELGIFEVLTNNKPEDLELFDIEYVDCKCIMFKIASRCFCFPLMHTVK